ncbi:MAG TPA: PEGA domain-containing protein [Cyclobacteriaceae bacterium]|nr:PEGA domain-containing protein [Cyclobacteriaceae bacterium]
MKKIIIGSIIIVTGMLSSCASIVHGNVQTIDFTSQPKGARIIIDGSEYGVTPSSIPLKRSGRFKGEISTKKEYAVKIELDGYYPYEIKIKREMDAWFLGNIIFGGLIGIIIDASSGAMYKLTPDQVVAQMSVQTAMIKQENDDRIYIAVALEVDPGWEKIGTLEAK